MLFHKKQKIIIALFLTYVILNTSASNRFVIFGSPRAGAIVEIDKHAYGLYSGITDIDFATCEIVTVVEEEKEDVTATEEIECIGYAQSDYELLAKVIYRETGNQGKECMLYCGSVILNRVKSNRYPDTIYGVVFQHIGNSYQYSVARNKDRLYNTVPSDTAYEVAKYLLENGSYIPDYVLYQHGNNRAVGGTRVYKRINGEVFSYD